MKLSLSELKIAMTFPFSRYSLYSSEEIHISCSSTAACVLSPETNHPPNKSPTKQITHQTFKQTGNVCHRGQSYRATVKPQKFSFL
jgi:hypothetical protein